MQLSSYPHHVVNVACRYCPRFGRYHLATLAACYGETITLEELARELAGTCTAAADRKRGGCNGVYFPDLDGKERPMRMDL